MNYVTSDIHGCYDQFMELLQKIKLKKEDTLYILGDVIDRGPEPIKCLLYIMQQPNMKLLMGNHDAFMLNYLDDYFSKKHYEKERERKKRNPFYKIQDFDSKAILRKDFRNANENLSCWMSNGGSESLQQLEELSEETKYDIYKFLYELPFYYIVDDTLLVHAGIMPCCKDISLEEYLDIQTDFDFTWIREDFYTDTKELPFRVIFGHTPIKYVKSDLEQEKYYKTIFKSKFDFEKENDYFDYVENQGVLFFNNKIAIDGACAYGGVLNCIRLDDMKIFVIKK